MNIGDIYKPIKGDLEKVERSLDLISDVDITLLSRLLEYSLRNGGKRIRPSLTLLSGKFNIYDLSLLVPMAAAMELLHTATLVHDDIVDKSSTRRGKPSVCQGWGGACALLLGDYLFAKAGNLVSSTGNVRVVELFSRTLMTISSGELAQIDILFDDRRSREHYYNWISKKTASLFATATESGAILSQASEDEITALRDYGLNFGMAFQIVDDVLDFIGQESELGKPVGSDLIEGAVTLPSILFTEYHPDGDLIKNIIESRDVSRVSLVLEKVRTSSVLDDCLDIASDFCSRACRAIEMLPDNRYRQALFNLANYVLRRRK
jgi:geranylgeranyl pyrophosphate synthase